MTSRFVALPVGQGDAFYLQRNDIHILVDGGRSRRAISGLLRMHTNADHLDIVVCTHNDADHANGLIGLLEELPVPVREVWLPGTWTWRFEDLVRRPVEFFKDLQNEVREVGKEIQNLEHYYTYKISERSRVVGKVAVDRDVLGEEDDATEWFLRIFQESSSWSLLHPYFWWRYFDFPPYRDRKKRLLLECINAAHRIKNIAEAALHAGARIRLFEFVEATNQVAGGIRGVLEPLNSREVRPRKVAVSALAFLALTVVNRESLVFYSPGRTDDNGPAVLFTADSDLACGLNHLQKPPTNVVITAPHHGSESNAMAYAVVNSWIKSPSDAIWVRSDCRSRLRPGKSFKSQLKRLCTLCNPPINAKAAVRLHATRLRWQRTRGTRWCTCK